MFSQFVFVLEIKIKRAFPLLVHMIFLFGHYDADRHTCHVLRGWHEAEWGSYRFLGSHIHTSVCENSNPFMRAFALTSRNRNCSPPLVLTLLILPSHVSSSPEELPADIGMSRPIPWVSMQIRVPGPPSPPAKSLARRTSCAPNWGVPYVCIYIYIYIYVFGSYKTTPTPTYHSGVKKITLFTPEGKKMYRHISGNWGKDM